MTTSTLAGAAVGPLTGEPEAMLVLSRKKNESIVIDQEIRITVVEIRGDKVRLGIEAPKEVPIHRSEIHEAIQSERAAAQQDAAASQVAGERANQDLT